MPNEESQPRTAPTHCHSPKHDITRKKLFAKTSSRITRKKEPLSKTGRRHRHDSHVGDNENVAGTESELIRSRVAAGSGRVIHTQYLHDLHKSKNAYLFHIASFVFFARLQKFRSLLRSRPVLLLDEPALQALYFAWVAMRDWRRRDAGWMSHEGHGDTHLWPWDGNSTAIGWQSNTCVSHNSQSFKQNRTRSFQSCVDKLSIVCG